MVPRTRKNNGWKELERLASQQAPRNNAQRCHKSLAHFRKFRFGVRQLVLSRKSHRVSKQCRRLRRFFCSMMFLLVRLSPSTNDSVKARLDVASLRSVRVSIDSDACHAPQVHCCVGLMPVALYVDVQLTHETQLGVQPAVCSQRMASNTSDPPDR